MTLEVSGSWTLLGTRGSARRAAVDERGIVFLPLDGLRISWAVGAEDRWYTSDPEPGRRQRLLGASPVVETRMRVPGGDVVHRVFGANPAGQSSPVLVIEIENLTPVPVAVAVDVALIEGRSGTGYVAPGNSAPGNSAPGNPTPGNSGRGRSRAGHTVSPPTEASQTEASHRSIAVEGSVVSIDGRQLIDTMRPPANAAVSGSAAEDAIADHGAKSIQMSEAMETAIAGDAVRYTGKLSCSGQTCSVALAYPLAHTAVWRAVVDLSETGSTALVGDASPSSGGVVTVGTSPDAGVGIPSAALPTAEMVAAGWAKQREAGCGVRLPDARLQAAFEAASCRLLLHANGGEVIGVDGSPVDKISRALVASSLGRLGFLDEATEIVAGVSEQILQYRGSENEGSPRDVDSWGAFLWMAGDVLGRANPESASDPIRASVAMAASMIDASLAALPRKVRRVRSGRSTLRDQSQGVYLMPPGNAPEFAGADGMRFWDDLWSLGGLVSAVRLFDNWDEKRASSKTRATTERLAGSLRAALEQSAVDGLASIGPGLVPDTRIMSMLVGSGVLEVLDPDVSDRIAEMGVRLSGESPGVPYLGPTGWPISELDLRDRLGTDQESAIDVRPTLLLAMHLVFSGDARGHDLLVRLISALPHSLSMPDLLDPGSRTAIGGEGSDPMATALLVLAVRAMLIREQPRVVDLAPVVPASWWGRRWELLETPTSFGSLSHAVRWKGDQPVIMWESKFDSRSRPSSTMPTFSASRLAPTWSSEDASGEIALPPIPAPAEPPRSARGRRISVAIGKVTSGPAATGKAEILDDDGS